jgi:hypothetical protein
MHIDPSKDFAYWEDHYAQAYGAAKQDVKAYHHYWQNKFDTVIYPADLKVQETKPGIREGEGFLRWRGQGILASSIDKCFSDEDFDRTDAILEAARDRNPIGVQKRLVDRLLLANRHNRMTFYTMRAVAESDIPTALKSADALLEFRIAHKNDLRMNWPHLFRMHADVCGVDVTALAATCASLTQGGKPLAEAVQSATNLVTNGGFESGLTGWKHSRWNENSGGAPCPDNSEVTVSTQNPFEGNRCVLFDVKPENRNHIYSIDYNVQSMWPGVPYLFRFAWKRETEGELTRLDTLAWPRFRLTFHDEKGELADYEAAGTARYWGEASDRNPNTEWKQVSRLIDVKQDSRIRAVSITIFSSSYSKNFIDQVEWLALK